MTFAEFFWLHDAKFAQKLSQATDQELMLDDKHNVRKRKGGKLSAWAGGLQAPMTLGISLVGSGIGMRNRSVAKRRLEMIHAELERRGLQAHAEDWKDAAFAALAVGAGTAVGMGFASGAEAAAQGFAEAGATHAAAYMTSVATTELYQNGGSLATEITTSHYTDPDTYFLRPKGIEASLAEYGYGERCYGTTTSASTTPPPSYTSSPTPTPSPQLQGMPQYMPIPPAPYYT